MSASSSNGTGNRFFGYLKGLFRRDDETNHDGGDDNSVVTEALPLVPPPVEVAFAAARTAPVAPAPTAPQANTNLDTLGAGVTPGVAIPLQAILNNLAPELRERVRVQTVGDLTINVSIDKVLSQLAQGQVRIPFGDLRKAAPQVFTPGVDFDRISVALPLNEILSRINPGLLVRRTAVRQVEVPEEIASPFSGKGEGLSLSVGNAKPVQPAAPRKATPVPLGSGRGSISSVTAPSAASMANIPAPFQFTPPAPKPATPPPAPPAPTLAPPIPFGNVFSAPARQTLPPAAAPAFVPQAFAPPQQQPVVHPVAPRVVQAVAAPKPPTTSQVVITTPLNLLTETWPESLRLEILQTNLSEVRIALPVDLIETALKRGRVVFPWKTIRSWISPATPTSVSVHDAAELELPLKVIAPLFLARKRNGSETQQRIAVDEAIPNLFFGFPQSEPAAPAPAPLQSLAMAQSDAPATPLTVSPAAISAAAASSAASAAASAAAAAATAVAAVSAKAAAAKPVDTNFYLWDDASDTRLFHIEALKQKGSSGTEFVKRYASPNEIVSRAASLDGVAGVLIALPDGLMVASRLPAELNGDTLAAFLPQIFAKVSACTKELRMGELNNVSFTVGNVPWKIFRVNAIFFAAFGSPAQAMPTAQLAGLAAELDRKHK